MTTPPPRDIPEPLYTMAVNACREQGVRGHVVHLAYKKWTSGARPEGCKYGHEQGIAHDCTCVGCIESLCFLFFDQVAAKFAAPITAYKQGLKV